MLKKFNYSNLEVTHEGNFKIMRKVSITNGVGYKSVSLVKNGKRKTIKKDLTEDQIISIKNKQFITGLFNDCYDDKCKKSISKNNKK